MKEDKRILFCKELVFFEEKMRDDKENIIVKKSFDFAVSVMKFTEELHEKKKYHLIKQIFKSGTSISANIREAQNAESKRDFIHKMKMAAKETDETEYWLELFLEFKYPVHNLLTDCREIQRILSKIISTSKKGEPSFSN